jgi:chorismate dehydratase
MIPPEVINCNTSIRSKEILEQIELVNDYPSKIASMLIEGKIDVGFIPVVAIPQLKEWNIISNYCIGAEKAVASVCLFSDVPLHQIERVLLDYQSKTSVNLCKVLLKHYWKISPVLENAKEDFREHIQGTTAGVVIGDRALEQRLTSPYIYNLAEAWQQFTGLPFVFAAWIANKELPECFCKLFNEANAVGLKELDKIVAENPYSVYDLNTYFGENISYCLNDEKRKGLEKFL